jgi:predicted transcriptional regulator
MAEEENTSLEMVTEIVSSYVSKNPVQVADLPNLIKTVFTSLSNLGKASEPQVDEIEKPTAAQIRKSIKPDGLVSFVDGKTYKTLKRHLTTTGLTIHEYKVKYGLPNDYPTTSPEYSAVWALAASLLKLWPSLPRRRHLLRLRHPTRPSLSLRVPPAKPISPTSDVGGERAQRGGVKRTLDQQR